MSVELKPFQSNERQTAFPVFKQELKPVIDEAIGWDEAYQRQGFFKRLQLDWFYWLYHQDEKVGLVCFREKPESIHVHLLILFSQHQGQGLASAFTSSLYTQAVDKGVGVSLSCFKNNERALHFYEKHGFEVLSEDNLFYDLFKR